MKVYTKPAMIVLGDAASLIQSSKPSFGENGNAMQPNTLVEEEGD
jgi:hypothetical protein